MSPKSVVSYLPLPISASFLPLLIVVTSQKSTISASFLPLLIVVTSPKSVVSYPAPSNLSIIPATADCRHDTQTRCFLGPTLPLPVSASFLPLLIVVTTPKPVVSYPPSSNLSIIPSIADRRHVAKTCCILPAPSNLSIIPATADRRHVTKACCILPCPFQSQHHSCRC